MIEPSLVMPRPVSNDGVDESGDHDAVDDVGDEVTPLSQWPGHKGGGSRREDELEKPLGVLVLWKRDKNAPRIIVLVVQG